MVKEVLCTQNKNIMSALVKLMDAWLCAKEAIEMTDFTVFPFLKEISLPDQLPQPPEPVKLEVKKAVPLPALPKKITRGYTSCEHMQKIINERNMQVADQELMRELSLPVKIDWKYVRKHRHLIHNSYASDI